MPKTDKFKEIEERDSMLFHWEDESVTNPPPKTEEPVIPQSNILQPEDCYALSWVGHGQIILHDRATIDYNGFWPDGFVLWDESIYYPPDHPERISEMVIESYKENEKVYDRAGELLTHPDGRFMEGSTAPVVNFPTWYTHK